VEWGAVQVIREFYVSRLQCRHSPIICSGDYSRKVEFMYRQIKKKKDEI
jgi:hypothetical protein